MSGTGSSSSAPKGRGLFAKSAPPAVAPPATTEAPWIEATKRNREEARSGREIYAPLAAAKEKPKKSGKAATVADQNSFGVLGALGGSMPAGDLFPETPAARPEPKTTRVPLPVKTTAEIVEEGLDETLKALTVEGEKEAAEKEAAEKEAADKIALVAVEKMVADEAAAKEAANGTDVDMEQESAEKPDGDKGDDKPDETTKPPVNHGEEDEELPEENTEGAGDEEKEEDNVSKHAAYRKKIIKVEELEAHMQWTEEEQNPEMYPLRTPMGIDISCVHRSYNAQDRYRPRSSKYGGRPGASGGKTMTPWASKGCVLTVFPDKSLEEQTFGALDPTSVVKVHYETVSQLPCVVLSINLSPPEMDAKVVKCYVYANALNVNYKPVGDTGRVKPDSMSFEWQNQRTNDTWIREHVPTAMDSDTAFQGLLKENLISALAMGFWPNEGPEADEQWGLYGVSPPNCKRTYTMWEGVSDEEFESWTRLIESQQLGFLTEGHKAVIALRHPYGILINEKVQHDAQPAYYDELYGYMTGVMSAAASWGPFWQYHLQMMHSFNEELNSPKVKLNKLLPIRQLVKTYEVSVDDSDRQVAGTLKPLTWSRFMIPSVFPTLGASAWLLSLGEYREIQKRQELLIDAINNSPKEILAKFHQAEADCNTRWNVSITMPDLSAGDGSVRVSQMLPKEGETFTIIIAEEQGLGKEGMFRGTFTDPIADSKITLSGVVYYSGHNKDAPPQPEAGKEYVVKLKLWDDNKPAVRKIRGVHELAIGTMNRKVGVDFTALLFNVPAVTRKHGAIADEIKDRNQLPNMMVNLDRLDPQGNRVYQLNTEQRDAVKTCYTSRSGAVIIHGPPGTGKTNTVVAMVEGLTKAGYRVAVVANANSQVDNAYSATTAKVEHIPANKAARARNIYFKSSTLDTFLHPEDASMAGANGPSAVDVDAESHLGKQIADKLIELSKYTSPVGKQARDYIELIAEHKKAVLANNKKSADALRTKLQALEPDLMPFCLNPVKMLFVTTNSAGHALLSKYAKVDVIVVEEAGLSSTSDLAVVLASFMEHAKLLIMAGDWKQQKPLCTSSDRNEASHLMAISQFQRLAPNSKALEGCGSSVPVDEVQLKVQYRSHPDIADPIAKAIYPKDGLVSDPSTAVVTPMVRTMQQFAQKSFGKAWKGHMRVAVCVDHTAAKSERMGRTTSLHNKAEAEAIADLVQKLLAFVPTSDAANPAVPITTKDIGISSPYTGQCVQIRLELQKLGIDIADASGVAVDVLTAGQIQGKEYPVHCISFCKRDPENSHNYGFVSDAGQTCVQMTRAKVFQALWGNFFDWDKIVQNETSKPATDIFFKVIKGLHETEDLMTWGDYFGGMTGKPSIIRSYKNDRVPGRDNSSFLGGGQGSGAAAGANAQANTQFGAFNPRGRGGARGGRGDRGGRGGHPRGGAGGPGGPGAATWRPDDGEPSNKRTRW
ncbi:hypothetical protein LTS10_011010 [Elasticomyces elasticus]|nr:hypothetical protein LTS10_011010 [Elasticomyces elasticus]